jgi:hypothetical protein
MGLKIYNLACSPGGSCVLPHGVILPCEFVQSHINPGKTLKNDAAFPGLGAIDEILKNSFQCDDPFLVIDCRWNKGGHVTVSHIDLASGCGSGMTNASFTLCCCVQSEIPISPRCEVLLSPLTLKYLSAKRGDTIRPFSSPGYLAMDFL